MSRNSRWVRASRFQRSRIAFVIALPLGQSALAQGATWGEFRASSDNSGALPGNLEVRWDVPIGQAVRAPPVSDKILIAGADQTGQVTAKELSSGRVIWRRRVPTSVHNDPLIGDSTVVVTFGDLPKETSPAGALGFDLHTGRVLWQYATKGPLMPSGALIGDVVVLLASDGCVHGIGLRDGLVRFRACFDSWAAMSNPKRVGGQVFLGTTDGHVVCIDGATGEARWIRRLPLVEHAGDETVAISPGALFIAGTSWNGYRILFRDTTFWAGVRIMLDAYVHDRFADRHTLFARQSVTRLSTESGEVIWSTQISSGRRVLRNQGGTAALWNNLVIVASPVGFNLSALFSADGRTAWVATLPSQPRSVPTVVGEAVFVGLASGELLGFGIRDGVLRGRCRWPGAFTPGAPLVVGKTFIYGASDGVLRAVPLRAIEARMRAGSACT